MARLASVRFLTSATINHTATAGTSIINMQYEETELRQPPTPPTITDTYSVSTKANSASTKDSSSKVQGAAPTTVSNTSTVPSVEEMYAPSVEEMYARSSVLGPQFELEECYLHSKWCPS
jgi:hypothetical protein